MKEVPGVGEPLGCRGVYHIPPGVLVPISAEWLQNLGSKYLGDLDGVCGSWLWPDPTLAAVGIWRVNQQVKISLFLCQLPSK